MAAAAKLVKEATITVCFLHAEFPKALASTEKPAASSDGDSDAAELSNLVVATATCLHLEDPLSPKTYLAADNKLPATVQLSAN